MIQSLSNTHPPDPPFSADRPLIGVTMGDPAGIGPEIVVKALSDPEIQRVARFVVFGMHELMAYSADQMEIEPFWRRIPHDTPQDWASDRDEIVLLDYDEFSIMGQAIHQPTRQGGQASLQFLQDAIAMAQWPDQTPGRLDAIVTAPICKASWKLAGCTYPGHTELFQKRTRARQVAMMFVSPQLRVILATIHLPLMDVRNVLSIGKVYDPIDLGHHACRQLGIEKPRIAVCGLNPHASENGLFGHEEQTIISPAIQMAREHGIDVHGPFSADTIYLDAINGRYDLVVAMYHDQGLIPVKLLAFDDAVNLTLGLPIIRTSPDHGTAFDIVGKNKARPDSLKAAIRLASQMADNDQARHGAG